METMAARAMAPGDFPGGPAELEACWSHAGAEAGARYSPTVKPAHVGVCRQMAVQSRVMPVPGCVRMPCEAPNRNLTPVVFSYVSVPPKHCPGREGQCQGTDYWKENAKQAHKKLATV